MLVHPENPLSKTKGSSKDEVDTRPTVVRSKVSQDIEGFLAQENESKRY